MPAGFTSAKFVGRESAFARFAPALEDAASGIPTTVLLEGTGGLGVSRFLTEATSRLDALAEPFTVLRGRAVPAGDDEPYAPILRALRPTLLAASDSDLVELLGPGIEDGLRLVPELHTRLGRSGDLPDRPTVTSPERRQARLLEGILGVLIRLGERQPVVLDPRGHPPRRRRHPCLRDVPRPRPAAASRLPRGDVPAGRGHALPPADRGDRGDDRGTPAGRSACRSSRSDATSWPISSRRSKASDRPAPALVLVAERSRGIPLVAEEVLAARRELSRASLPGSFEDLVVARLALRSPECRRILRLLAPAGRPLTMTELADVAAAYELTADDRPPPRSTTAAAARRRPDRRRSHGRPRRGGRARHPRGRPTTASTSGTSSSVVRSSPTCCPDSGFATTWRWRPASSATRPPPRATGSRPTRYARHERPRSRRPVAPRPSMRPRTRSTISSSPCRRSWRRARRPVEREAARRARIEAPATTCSTPRRSRSGPPRRRSRPVARHGRSPMSRPSSLRSTSGSDRLELGVLYERLARYRRSVGDLDGALSALRRAVSLVPPEPSVERATVLAALSQVRMLDGTFSEAESLAREAIAVATAYGPEAQQPGRPRDDDARRVARLGRGPRGRRDAPAAVAAPRRGDGRPRRDVPGLRQPHDGPRPRRPARGGGRRRLRGRRGDATAPGSRRSTATSCAATPRIRCSSSAAGRSRGR